MNDHNIMRVDDVGGRAKRAKKATPLLKNSAAYTSGLLLDNIIINRP